MALDLLSTNMEAKEVVANALFNAMASVALFGRRDQTTEGLTWGYYGGAFRTSGKDLIQIANGTILLTASKVNYIEANSATGVISANITGFTYGNVPVCVATTGASTITSEVDYRVGTHGDGSLWSGNGVNVKVFPSAGTISIVGTTPVPTIA